MMMKVIGLLFVLVGLTVAQTCVSQVDFPTPVGNISVGVHFDSMTSDGKYQFAATVTHNTPISLYNSANARITDVNSFAFATDGSVARAHLVYNNINGGAYNIQYFTLPSSMVGDNHCILIGFAYVFGNAEHYFYGNFKLSTSAAARSEEMIEEGALAARSCGTVNAINTPYYTGSGSAPTSNTYAYNCSGTVATSISFTAVDPSGNNQIAYNGAHSWTGCTTSGGYNGVRGSITISCGFPGSFTVTNTLTYTSCGTVTNYVTYVPLTCTSAKRAIDGIVYTVQPAANPNVAIAIASAGVAVAAVAVVAVVVVIRRKNSDAMSA